MQVRAEEQRAEKLEEREAGRDWMALENKEKRDGKRDGKKDWVVALHNDWPVSITHTDIVVVHTHTTDLPLSHSAPPTLFPPPLFIRSANITQKDNFFLGTSAGSAVAGATKVKSATTMRQLLVKAGMDVIDSIQVDRIGGSKAHAMEARIVAKAISALVKHFDKILLLLPVSEELRNKVRTVIVRCGHSSTCVLTHVVWVG